MKTIELSEVSALAPYVQRGGREPVVLTENGEALAAIVPANAEEIEDLLLSMNPRFQAVLERSQQRLESEGGLSSAQVRERLGLPPRQ
jgi:hypothetical protein